MPSHREQKKLLLISLRGFAQPSQGVESATQLTARFDVRGAGYRPLTGLKPEPERGFRHPALVVVVRNELGLSRRRLRKLRDEYFGDPPMMSLPGRLQQRFVRLLLNQRVTERVYRRVATTLEQLGRNESVEGGRERRIAEGRARAEDVERKLATQRCAMLGQLFRRSELIQARHERILKRRGNERSTRPVVVAETAASVSSTAFVNSSRNSGMPSERLTISPTSASVRWPRGASTFSTSSTESCRVSRLRSIGVTCAPCAHGG